MLFIRHSEGIYSYGSRKISLKNENDKLKVRVGGGYLSIEEFIEQYGTSVTNTTIDMHYQDPSSRLAERVKMNKYIDPTNPNMQITIGRNKSPSVSRQPHQSPGHSSNRSRDYLPQGIVQKDYQRANKMDSLGYYEDVDED